ncbi:MAG TPA: hypothetical protein DCQ26_03850 [Marinilabiliales bacterium]|nr:MAG: hypothetical protein A2W84_00960 [Bacteroidetes bacterium GWC2_40_13]OFX71393.1 MAG: hypothetical protein A2W96_14660 [Bacteroidetes bacterium GWD2_40_43]OFX91411.1 MAG: hypothetical protein A2W97_04195 [Bacteroidetes bacterium GWE2_40_63]OFY19480.1 MAG: hypothetical protein A2W88_02075 [Bacteroidetes bacterium GWF2_40_13]OFZ25629.1 MAG: hypothetical protein A2437_12480 [Bacteroidetes bacterium RIFOXYC2_FULL_40_12]HAM97721.1 hypothetical protein [Marinilabiliales bacterium]
MKAILILLIFVGLYACDTGDKSKPSGAEGWLKGDENQKFETIAKQLRGFDMAMVETGYRYQELYWAGKDENWEYAAYQAEKIKVAIENGLERRPKRAASAQNFLNIALPEMGKAIASRDTIQFKQAFTTLTANCIACHVLEKVSFVTVKTPVERQSPVRK